MKSWLIGLSLIVAALAVGAQEGSPAYEACMHKKELPKSCADLLRLSKTSTEMEKREAALRSKGGKLDLAEAEALHKEWAVIHAQATTAQ